MEDIKKREYKKLFLENQKKLGNTNFIDDDISKDFNFTLEVLGENIFQTIGTMKKEQREQIIRTIQFSFEDIEL